MPGWAGAYGINPSALLISLVAAADDGKEQYDNDQAQKEDGGKKNSTKEMFLALIRATIPKPMVASSAPMVAGVALGFGDGKVKEFLVRVRDTFWNPFLESVLKVDAKLTKLGIIYLDGDVGIIEPDAQGGFQ